jgi:hypothetical protein
MATRTWLDQDGDWSNTSNWSGGSAPTASDDVEILEGEQDITTSLPGSGSGINYASLTVGPNFTGSIGTAGAPLYVGDVASVTYRSRLASQCFIAVDSGDDIAKLIVDGTGGTAYGLMIVAGTVTDAVVKSAQRFRIGASATVTTLRSVGQDVVIVAESGSTLTTVNAVLGNITCYGAAGTINMAGATWNHVGQTVFNVTTLNLYSGTFHNHAGGGTTTTVNQHGGTYNANGGKGQTRTVTTYNQYAGSLDRRNLGSTLILGTHNRDGGTDLV